MTTDHEKAPLRPKGGRQSYRKLLAPAPVFGVCAMLAFSGWFVFGRDGVWDRHKLAVRYTEQDRRIAELEAERADLEKYLADLKVGDQAALEAAARDYHMVGQGEQIYEVKIVEPQPEK